MPVGFKPNAFRFQQRPLFTPPRCRAPLFVHHPMTGQLSGHRRIPQRPSHHPCMTRPSRQCGNISIRCHLSTRNLTHNVQHILTKPPRLFGRHPVRIVLHLSHMLRYYSSKPFILQPSALSHQKSSISPQPSDISNPLVLPSVNLCECKKFFELLYPLRLQFPSIQRFTIRLQPIEHIMLLYPMLRRISMILLYEGFHLIISCQPTSLLIHLTSYFLLIPCCNNLPVHNLPEGSEMSCAAVLVI